MGLSNEELTQAILDYIGGAANVFEVSIEKDRLRFILKHNELIKEETLKKINCVKGIIEADGIFYLILDDNRTELVYKVIVEKYPETLKKSELPEEKKNMINRIRDFFRK